MYFFAVFWRVGIKFELTFCDFKTTNRILRAGLAALRKIKGGHIMYFFAVFLRFKVQVGKKINACWQICQRALVYGVSIPTYKLRKNIQSENTN
jgi:hypothetical protein